MRVFNTRVLAIFAALGLATAAHAQFPEKPITLIVPFAPGGNADIRARELAVPVAKTLGQAIIIQNRPGAGGNLGMGILARAEPDGYTLGMGTFGPMAVNQYMYSHMLFDPVKDFIPVLLIEKAPLALSTRVDKPFKSVKDVIDSARSKPGHLSIGNTGQGGAHHLAAEIFEQAAGIDMIGVPYKGGGPASNAVMSGEVDMMFEQTYAAYPSFKAGKYRVLAVTSEKRLDAMPDAPTMAELGFPQVTVSNWVGLVAPKGTPPDIVKVLNEAFGKALASAQMRERIESISSVVGGGSPQDFSDFIASERKRWAPVIKSRGIKLE